MCGRYGLDGKRIDLELEFSARMLVEVQPRYNIAPTTPILIVKDTPQGRIGTFHLWGLIPSWANDPSIGTKMINARSETAAEKPSFRNALKRRRCLVPASGFYEWQSLGKGQKQPYWIHRKDGSFLAFAGLWESWQGPNGEELDTCTILTTTPNELMAPIHDRMPVILRKEHYDVWLNCEDQTAKGVVGLFRPCPASWLAVHPVGSAVGNPRNEGAELIQAKQ